MAAGRELGGAAFARKHFLDVGLHANLSPKRRERRDVILRHQSLPTGAASPDLPEDSLPSLALSRMANFVVRSHRLVYRSKVGFTQFGF
mmetsp:Transcript_58586/g.130512  ORF Transcript_58586/g.130512 Transcript_58586/m.130512 type:complete len:89 (+) Transcript_58586:462-728(+)